MTMQMCGCADLRCADEKDTHPEIAALVTPLFACGGKRGFSFIFPKPSFQRS